MASKPSLDLHHFQGHYLARSSAPQTDDLSLQRSPELANGPYGSTLSVNGPAAERLHNPGTCRKVERIASAVGTWNIGRSRHPALSGDSERRANTGGVYSSISALFPTPAMPI